MGKFRKVFPARCLICSQVASPFQIHLQRPIVREYKVFKTSTRRPFAWAGLDLETRQERRGRWPCSAPPHPTMLTAVRPESSAADHPSHYTCRHGNGTKWRFRTLYEALSYWTRCSQCFFDLIPRTVCFFLFKNFVLVCRKKNSSCVISLLISRLTATILLNS